MTAPRELMHRLCSADAPESEKRRLIESVRPEETDGEFLFACAQVLLERAVPLELDGIDVCGTGGDSAKNGTKTFNVSTAVAFVAAAGGAPIIKHGNRAVSSQSGSSDVLAALGITPCATPGDAERQFQRHGLCFVSAPSFHPALRQLAEVRKSVGRATFLNLLGPLCNPARTRRQLTGVFDAKYIRPLAEAARRLGKTDMLAVHSEDGLDEISIGAKTQACRLQGQGIASSVIRPEDAGIPMASLDALAGGTAAENAAIIQSVFSGAPGPAADIVVINAAAVFMLAGLDADLRQGVARARRLLSAGLALKKLHELRG